MNSEKVVDGFRTLQQVCQSVCYCYLQGKTLQQNIEKGIIMSTQSLVLQSVSKSAVGDYTCRAVNSEGAGESNPIPLKIMCKYLLMTCFCYTCWPY